MTSPYPILPRCTLCTDTRTELETEIGRYTTDVAYPTSMLTSRFVGRSVALGGQLLTVKVSSISCMCLCAHVHVCACLRVRVCVFIKKKPFGAICRGNRITHFLLSVTQGRILPQNNRSRFSDFNK